MAEPTPTSTAPDEAARAATAADVDAIATLAEELRAALVVQKGGPLWIDHEALPAPTSESIAARLGAEGLATMVGTLDGVVLAYGLAHLETLPDGRVLAVVDELLVTEPARAVGLGRTLLDTLVTWAGTAGAFGIDATALPGDRLAKNFFEAAGFTARRLVM
ncbi:MAG: N-acetyltransferase family protein, partial [Acidimicrobiia bacterium]